MCYRCHETARRVSQRKPVIQMYGQGTRTPARCIARSPGGVPEDIRLEGPGGGHRGHGRPAARGSEPTRRRRPCTWAVTTSTDAIRQPRSPGWCPSSRRTSTSAARMRLRGEHSSPNRVRADRRMRGRGPRHHHRRGAGRRRPTSFSTADEDARLTSERWRSTSRPGPADLAATRDQIVEHRYGTLRRCPSSSPPPTAS